ncbi:hypothetical protein OOU_Y34scaffold00606g8 [Pyricularia oryzae Y34]|uniref:Uncharacterized protein n=1 Tax=Pyricularia oryzae (strain Y34) TaxID=1143189 RepID=A0AA97PJU4_PYRO3|nr:hypothetical protein OOU_Y34scaffold00606g8 [Pyricularia oryzae Y34]
MRMDQVPSSVRLFGKSRDLERPNVLSGTIPYLGFQSIISLYKRALVPGCLGGCLDTYVISSILRQEQHWLGERPFVSSKVFQILDAEERYLKSGGRSTYVQ